MTSLLLYAVRREADELSARLPHIGARRERGKKEAAYRELLELRRQEIELAAAERKAGREARR